MSDVTFSLLHASRGRPTKAVAAMKDALAKADNPSQIDYIVAANDDDQETIAAFDKLAAMVVFGPFRGSVEAWNAAAKMARGDILIQMQDDLVLPSGWDGMLRSEYEDGRKYIGERIKKCPAVIAVHDGYRNDALLCTAIMNRARYEQQGEFLHAGYQSMYSDDEFSVRAYSDAAEGRCTLIDATDIVFRHDNPLHLKQPCDETHQRQNSAEAYAKGAALFRERNGHLMKWRTWG